MRQLTRQDSLSLTGQTWGDGSIQSRYRTSGEGRHGESLYTWKNLKNK